MLYVLKKLLAIILIVYSSSDKAYSQYSTASQEEKAKESLQVIAYPESENPLSVVVRFDNYHPKDLIFIVILNSKKKVLHRESATGRRYGRTFNLSTLPDGEYTIKVFNKRTTYIQKFQVETLYKSKNPRVASFDQLTKEF